MPTSENIYKNIDNFDFGVALSNAVSFTLDVLCDWAIELSKPAIFEGGKRKQNMVSVLAYVFEQTLKLLHPFIPFVTEKIYLELPNHDESIMISSWPEKTHMFDDETTMEEVMNIIKTIHNTRAEKKVPDNKKIDAEILIKNNFENYNSCLSYIQKLALINELKVVESQKEISDNSVTLTFNDVLINLPLDSMVDSGAEKERIEKEILRLKSEIERSEKLLSNEGFVAKAPAKLIESEKEKLQKNKQLKEELEKSL